MAVAASRSPDLRASADRASRRAVNSAGSNPYSSSRTGARSMARLRRGASEQVAGVLVEEPAGAGALLGGDVVRVAQVADPQGQAAAADAGIELVPHPFELGDAAVEERAPGAAQPLPVRRRRRPLVGKRPQGLSDLVEGQAHPLRGP